jgi:TRAP transporter TAXI family solute receptor
MKRHIIRNNSRKKKLLNYLFSSIILGASLIGNASNINHIKIATGTMNGIYFPLASEICKFYNSNRDSKNSRCTPLTSFGSVSNLVNLKRNSANFAMLQSEIQDYAYSLKPNFNDPENKNIRSLFSLYRESLTVIVRNESSIKNINDIKGKRINIGNKDSGGRTVFDMVLDELKFSYDDFKKVTEHNIYQQSSELCNNQIDVAVYLLANPSAAIQELTKNCNVRIIPVKGLHIEDLIKKNKSFEFSIIPCNLYPNNFNDLEISLRAKEQGLQNYVIRTSNFIHFESKTRNAKILETEKLITILNQYGVKADEDPYKFTIPNCCL